MMNAAGKLQAKWIVDTLIPLSHRVHAEEQQTCYTYNSTEWSIGWFSPSAKLRPAWISCMSHILWLLILSTMNKHSYSGLLILNQFTGWMLTSGCWQIEPNPKPIGREALFLQKPTRKLPQASSNQVACAGLVSLKAVWFTLLPNKMVSQRELVQAVTWLL